jgi:hypothetical protein
MKPHVAFVLCSVLAAPLTTNAQSVARTLKARVVYLEPSSEDPAELFVTSTGGRKIVKLIPGASIGQDKVDCPVPSSGKVEFTKTKDSKNAVAIAEIPTALTDANLFFIKRDKPSESELPYQVAVIDNSRAVVPDGGTFVLNLTDSDVQVTVGDQSGEMPPGKSHTAKRPESRDEYQMAPFILKINNGGDWKPLKDNMMRFAESERYFVIIHAPVKGGRPAVKIYKQAKP